MVPCAWSLRSELVCRTGPGRLCAWRTVHRVVPYYHCSYVCVSPVMLVQAWRAAARPLQRPFSRSQRCGSNIPVRLSVLTVSLHTQHMRHCAWGHTRPEADQLGDTLDQQLFTSPRRHAPLRPVFGGQTLLPTGGQCCCETTLTAPRRPATRQTPPRTDLFHTH